MATSPKVKSVGRHGTGPARAAGVQASHQGRALASLFAAGAAALTVLLAIWAMPWVPVGMTRDDYSAHVVVALVLAMGIALMGLIAAFAYRLPGGQVELAEILHSLLGRRARLRNLQQFCNRLARECQRAQRGGRSRGRRASAWQAEARRDHRGGERDFRRGPVASRLAQAAQCANALDTDGILAPHRPSRPPPCLRVQVTGSPTATRCS